MANGMSDNNPYNPDSPAYGLLLGSEETLAGLPPVEVHEFPDSDLPDEATLREAFGDSYDHVCEPDDIQHQHELKVAQDQQLKGEGYL